MTGIINKVYLKMMVQIL